MNNILCMDFYIKALSILIITFLVILVLNAVFIKTDNKFPGNKRKEESSKKPIGEYVIKWLPTVYKVMGAIFFMAAFAIGLYFGLKEGILWLLVPITAISIVGVTYTYFRSIVHFVRYLAGKTAPETLADKEKFAIVIVSGLVVIVCSSNYSNALWQGLPALIENNPLYLSDLFYVLILIA